MTKKSSSGGIANRKNVLAAKNEAKSADFLKNSRILCVCQARIHELVMNCLGCGRIICMQEGSGPCLTCGTLVCTVEERELINLGTKRGRELLENLQSRGGAASSNNLEDQNKSYQDATEFRDRLLRADADTQHRTRVNDLQSDYSNAENSPFLSLEDREALKKRREELRELREKERKRFVVSIDLNGGIVEQKNAEISTINDDPIINRIIEKADDRRRAQETAFANSNNASWSPIGFVPKYISENSCSNFEPKSDGDVIDVESLMIVSDEIAAQMTEQKGFTIALQQPIATFIVNGVIKFVRWKEDLMLKGPLFIVSKTGSVDEKQIVEFSKMFVRDTSRKVNTFDFADGAVLGRAYLEDCLHISDFLEKYGSNSKIPGEGDYLLKFTVVEPLLKSIPHIHSTENSGDIYEMDRQLKKSLARW